MSYADSNFETSGYAVADVKQLRELMTKEEKAFMHY